jgi:hypothetical protein
MRVPSKSPMFTTFVLRPITCNFPNGKNSLRNLPWRFPKPNFKTSSSICYKQCDRDFVSSISVGQVQEETSVGFNVTACCRMRLEVLNIAQIFKKSEILVWYSGEPLLFSLLRRIYYEYSPSLSVSCRSNNYPSIYVKVFQIACFLVVADHHSLRFPNFQFVLHASPMPAWKCIVKSTRGARQAFLTCSYYSLPFGISICNGLMCIMTTTACLCNVEECCKCDHFDVSSLTW